MTKKPLCTLLQRFGFLALIALLSACSCSNQDKSPEATATSQAPDAEAGRTPIAFAVYDGDESTYQDLIQAFEAANPELGVRLVSINEILELDLMEGDWPDDAWQRLATRADVINVEVDPEVVRQGLARDLTPFIQSDPNFQRDDFYPGVLESAQWEGGTWYLPTGVSFDLIYYDKDAFDAAGLAYPQPGWTWDDFLDAARALTLRQGNQVTQWGFVQPWPNHLPFIEGRAGPLIDGTTDPPTPRFDQPEVRDAVRWYADLYLKEEVVPFFETPDEDDVLSALQGQSLVEDGQAAMWRESSMFWAWRRRQGNRGAVPYPVGGPDAQTTPLWPPGLSMSAGTAHPEAAWRWMDFVSRQDTSGGGPFAQRLPARRSAAEASGFWDEIDPELAETLRYALDHGYAVHWLTERYAAPYGDELEAVLAGDKSVDEALDQVQEQVEADIETDRAQKAEATPIPTFVVIAPDEQPADGAGVTTITFSPGMGAMSNMQAYRDAARDFEALHPEIRVEVNMPEFDGRMVAIPSLAENSDCFQWSPDVQDPQNQRAVLSLEPFLDADPSFDTGDFYPALLEQFTWQGQLLGLPAELQPYVVEYNRDLFDAAGVDYPALDWTTDDFADASVTLTRGEGDNKQYGFVPGAIELIDMLLLIERRGAKLIDDSADPPTLTLNDPATVEALRWYARLTTEHQAKPVFLTDLAQVTDIAGMFLEQEALVSEGRAGMWTQLGPMAMVDLGGGRDQLNTGVAPLPAGSEGISGGGTTTGYYISAQTDARQACWQWLTYLTEQPNLAQGLPARRSVAESAAYRQRVGTERVAVYQASAASVAAASSFDVFVGETWLAGGIVWLGRAYSQIVEEGVDVQEALNAAQTMADDYRACVVAQDAFGDQDAWMDCMQEVDPSIPLFLFEQGE